MLADLYAGALADAGQREEYLPIDELEAIALSTSPAINAIPIFAAGQNIKVIAEIKRASPSKGNLAEIPHPDQLGLGYQRSGASAISILTEGRRFLGTLEDFDLVRAVCEVPLLRKDFIATEYQVLEARAHGADIVLLIAAGLEKDRLIRLKNLIESLGMTALIETHNRSEVEFAAEISSELVGINARDLSTFDTDRDLFASLAPLLPNSCIKVAESAVRSVEDVAKYAEAGADAVLVGEALVRGDSESLIRSFIEIPRT